MSNLLKIAVLAGHGESLNGGYDSGAVNPRLGLHEFKIVKEIAKYCSEHLKGYECQVDLLNYDGHMNLNERIVYANKMGYDIVIEVHTNAHTSLAYGTEAYYYVGDTRGKNIADKMCKELSSALSIPQRTNGVDDGGDKTTDYFGIVCKTKATAVLVETAFISTDCEAKKMDEPFEQKSAGEAIGKGIAKALSLKAKNIIPIAPAIPQSKPVTGLGIRVTKAAGKPLTANQAEALVQMVQPSIYCSKQTKNNTISVEFGKFPLDDIWRNQVDRALKELGFSTEFFNYQ